MNLVDVEKTQWGFWVTSEDQILAGVVSGSFKPRGVEFVTNKNLSLQVAVMNREQGHTIASHEHLPVPRSLEGTNEVLIIRNGELRTDLYREREYLGSVLVSAGDTLILVSGGHGFEASTDCIFIEVKQGPFVEGKDKIIFESKIDKSDLRWIV